MDDEDNRNDNLRHNLPVGGKADAAVEGLDGERCNAASDHTYTMQNTGERGASGAASSEMDTDTDIWETINSLVKQVCFCCFGLCIDQENDEGVGGEQECTVTVHRHLIILLTGIDFCSEA